MSTLSLWTRRDPFAEFDALVRNAFEPAADARRTPFTPAAEIFRDGDDAVVRVEVPGLDPEADVTVEVDRGRLIIRGERRDERTEEKGGRTLRELRYGAFHRSFVLPSHVTSEAISAAYDAGVLSVRVAGAHANGGAHRIAVSPAAATLTPEAPEAPETPEAPKATEVGSGDAPAATEGEQPIG